MATQSVSRTDPDMLMAAAKAIVELMGNAANSPNADPPLEDAAWAVNLLLDEAAALYSKSIKEAKS